MSGQQKAGAKGKSGGPPPANTNASGAGKKGGKCKGGCANPVPNKPATPAASAPNQSGPASKVSVPAPLPTPPAPAVPTATPVEDKEEALRKENLELKTQQKDLETKLNDLQAQLEKTDLMNVRLEGLCAELKNRTKALTEESTTKIQEAEDRGKTLTDGVSQNLGLMNNINDSIQQITKDNLDSRKFNENLSDQIANMKSEYEKSEAVIQEQIQATHDKIIKAHMELAQTKLDNSQDKEKTFTELKRLATAVVESREQMQTIKQTELTLRQHIQNYDEKFVGLQVALKETNAAYDGFKGEMEKLAETAKTLEGDATKWQNKWEESNCALALVEKTHARLQAEMQRTTVSLEKMNNLYKALRNQKNQTESVKDPKNQHPGKNAPAATNTPVTTSKSPTPQAPVQPIEPVPEAKVEPGGKTPEQVPTVKQSASTDAAAKPAAQPLSSASASETSQPMQQADSKSNSKKKRNRGKK